MLGFSVVDRFTGFGCAVVVTGSGVVLVAVFTGAVSVIVTSKFSRRLSFGFYPSMLAGTPLDFLRFLVPPGLVGEMVFPALASGTVVLSFKACCFVPCEENCEEFEV